MHIAADACMHITTPRTTADRREAPQGGTVGIIHTEKRKEHKGLYCCAYLLHLSASAGSGVPPPHNQPMVPADRAAGRFVESYV